MKQIYKKTIVVFLACLMFTSLGFAQQGNTLWTKTTAQKASKKAQVIRKSDPIKADFYSLNIEALKTALQTAPDRKTFQGQSNLVIQFPNSSKELESFRIKEASIMEEALQLQFPNMRSYVGQSIENPSTTIRFSVTPKGLNLINFSDKGTQFIDAYTTDGVDYIVYNKKDLRTPNQSWQCDYVDEIEEIEENTNKTSNSTSNRNANDGTMREFRLALACTVEYSQFHGNTLVGVMDAMAVTMTRVNGIYERELSITMVMVPNTNIIFLGQNVNSDPYTNDNGPVMLGENQIVCDSNIGFSNYDIGHVFSTGGGGIASLNSPCTTGKARGVTGLNTPIGDAFDVDYVSHEMGHQFGGPHTFNGNAPGSSCLTQRSASNAYEPGSGSTIMAYAGICAPQNVQNVSDDYFHQKSLDEIFDNITNGNSQCANLIATGNAAPTSDAGGDFIIPSSTPYVLTGSSTDADGTASHTYTWEQFDLGPTGAPTETTVLAPIVRSFKGTSNPSRYIPQLPSIIQNGGVSSEWEKLASINRSMTFALTVRDNDIVGGQTAVDEMTVTVDASNTTPFAVTSQDVLTSWAVNDTQTITWDVANTNTGVVNTPNVDILLSTDGGLSFPTVLASAVPNDGSHDITVPDLPSDNCRIMVKGNGNIFFNINTARLAIGFSFSESCTTYNFDINQTIAPNATAFEFFDENVNDSGVISDVNVKYDITTSNLSELHLAMISPEGTRSYLYVAGSCTNTDGSANIQTTFDDEAAGPIACGTDPLVGTATTANITTPEPLTAIYQQEMNGQWRFMAANVGPSNMVFNTVDLEICKIVSTSLSVSEFNFENSFTLFPNPNKGEFTLKFNSDSKNITVSVFDIRGRSVYNKSYTNSETFEQSINLGNVQSGMYLLNVNDGKRTITKKIVVE